MLIFVILIMVIIHMVSFSILTLASSLPEDVLPGISELALCSVLNLGLTCPPAWDLCLPPEARGGSVPLALYLDCRGEERCHWKKTALPVHMCVRSFPEI